jgi:excisionase family DNA binding protein
MADEPLLTPAQVAARLQLSRLTIVEYLRSQRLRGVKLDRHWRVREADLQAFLAARLMAWAAWEEEEVPTPLVPDGEGAGDDRSAEVGRDPEPSDGPDPAHRPTGPSSLTSPPRRGKPRRVAPTPPVEAAAEARPIAPRPAVAAEEPAPVVTIPEASVPRRRVGTWGRG